MGAAATPIPVRQGTDEWLAARREGIGSSDAAVIAGEKGSLLALWGEKTGLAPKPEPDDATAEMWAWGHRMEPLVAEAYTERTGRPLRRVNRLLQHPQTPWALASLDRVSAVKGERRIVELKVTDIDARFAGDDLPGDVEAQIRHQMWVTGFDVAEVAVLQRHWRLKLFTIEVDDAYTADLVYLEREFWRQVEAREMPAVDGSENARRVLTQLHQRNSGQMLPPAADLDLLAEELRLAKAEAKAADDRQSTIENAIRAVIGDADGFEGSWGRVTWKRNADSTKTDWKAIGEELVERVSGAERVEILTRHTRVVEGPRVLRPTFKEER
jgi:putative phage-type endonuclease